MTHIHYKFSSKLCSNTVIFDGPHITLRELKKLIMAKEKLRSGDCDLQVTNAQTKEEYKDDEGPVPKGSSVIVRRIPIIGARSGSKSKTRNIEQLGFQTQLHNVGAASAMDDRNSSRALPLFSKMTNLAAENVSEEDKIKAVLYQSAYGTMSYSTKSGASLPANYTCYRCGNTGHHIRNCPTAGDKNSEPGLRLKKSTGIPRSFMVQVDDPNIKGAMLTNCGSYAIPAIHANAYAVGKKEKPPFAPPEAPVVVQEEPIPNELLCLICHELLSDAVVIPCCGNSFCDDCIRTALLDSDQHSCPSCNQSEVSPDSLIANKFLRKAVNTFQIEQDQRNRGSVVSQPQNPTPAPSPVPALPPLSLPAQPQKLETLQAEAPVASPQSSRAPPTTTSHALSASKHSASPKPAQSVPAGAETENVNEDAAAPSEPVASLGDSPAARQAGEEQLQTAGGAPRPQQAQQAASSDRAPGRSQPVADNTCWNAATRDPPPSCSSSSSYPATPQPLFNSPPFHPFLSAQQHPSGYPPGYPPPVPIWMLQTPPGSEWYMPQGRKSQGSPRRDSTYRSSPCHSKSKSSRSYSRSSSRSRSRSRSLSRSRRRSPFSRHRSIHARSHPSYSYGYKRSPTPSSSSSPPVAYRSRSRSPSDQRKKSHHHGRRSTSSRHGSRRRAESPHAEKPYGRREERDGGLDPERQRYLQWEREYKEWCEKYFNSYVSHFHQPPPAPFHLHPAALAPWREKEERRPHGRYSAQQGDLSPPSHSSSDCCSATSRSVSDSRSSASPVPSTRSQSSNDRPSTPLEPKVPGMRESQAVTEESDDSELQEGREEEKSAKTRKSTSVLKQGRRSKKDQEGRGECFPEPADSVDDDRRNQWSCRSGNDDRRAAKSDKTHRRKRDLAREKSADRGRHSDSRPDGQSRDKRRHSKEGGRSDKEKHGRPRGKSGSRSEKSEKRKRQEKAGSLLLHKTGELQTWESESYQQPDEKEKMERPVTDDHIWEGGMKVKAQKKISINISLDARRTEVKTDDSELIYLGDAPTGKTGGEEERPQDGCSRMEEEDGKRDEREGIWDVTSSGDRQVQMEEETSRGAAAGDSGLCTLGVDEEEEKPQAETQCGEKWRSIDRERAEVLAATGGDEEERTNLHGGLLVSKGDVSTDNLEEQKAVANAVEQRDPARASEGEEQRVATQILSSNLDLMETEEGKLDVNDQTDAAAVSHPSQSAWVTTASRKTEVEKGPDWRGITDRETITSSNGALAPSGCKDADSPPSDIRDSKAARREQKESRRWKEKLRESRSLGSSSHRADRETNREAMTSDSKIRSKHSPDRRHTYERHTGSRHHRSPTRTKERKRRASSPVLESSGKWPRDELEGSHGEVVDGVDLGWELEEGERPSSGGSKSSGSSTGGCESRGGRKRWRASPEPLDDWRPRKHRHRE